MSEFVPRPEFERVVKSTDNHLSSINTNITKIADAQQRFIKSQVKFNTKTDCHIKEVKSTQKTFKKVAFIFLGCFSGLAGLGFYSSLPAEPVEQQKEEINEVLVSND